MKLNPFATALSAGILGGLGLLLATWWVMLFGTGGTTIKLIGNFYIGYSVSIIGSIIGLVWGFVDWFVIGFIFATLYNRFSCSKTEVAE